MIVESGNVINYESPLNRNLVGWWMARAPYLSGATWRDLTGKYSGTLTNTPQRQQSHGRPAGKASLFFDGTDDIVSVADDTVWNGGQSYMTWAAWLRPTASDTSQRSWIMKGDYSNTANWSYALQWTPTFGNVRVFVAISGSDVGGSYYDTTSGGIAANTWHHVVVVFDGTQALETNRIRVYLNGNLMTGSSPNDDLPTTIKDHGSTYAMTFGSFVGLGRYFLGQMDDVRIFHRAPPAQEVKHLYLDSRDGYRHTLRRAETPCWVEPAAAPGGLAIPIAAYHYNHHLGSMAG